MAELKCPAEFKHGELKLKCKENKLSQCGTKDALFSRLVKAKIIEVSEVDGSETESHEKRNYDEMKVTELRVECKSRGLPTGK